MSKLTQKQYELLFHLAENPGRCQFHRGIPRLSPASTITISGKEWTRIEDTVRVLEQLGYIGVNRKDYTATSWPIYSLPPGREYLAKNPRGEYRANQLKIVDNNTPAFQGGYSVEVGDWIIAGPYAAKGDAQRAKRAIVAGVSVAAE